MTCPHWHGELVPCPACIHGEDVGGLDWPVDAEQASMWEGYLRFWARTMLDSWERDWRTRLGAAVELDDIGDGDARWDRWHLHLVLPAGEIVLMPAGTDTTMIRWAAAKLRRMRP